VVGARTFPRNPDDGHILAAQLAQTGILLEDVGRTPKEVVVDLGFRVNSDLKLIQFFSDQRFKTDTPRHRKRL
jgi:IS5 family transposase